MFLQPTPACTVDHCIYIYIYMHTHTIVAQYVRNYMTFRLNEKRRKEEQMQQQIYQKLDEDGQRERSVNM